MPKLWQLKAQSGHVRRVLKSAQEIQAEIGGDRLVVELAAWLHDVGDAKFHAGFERSAEFAREILTRLDVDNEIIEHVALDIAANDFFFFIDDFS